MKPGITRKQYYRMAASNIRQVLSWEKPRMGTVSAAVLRSVADMLEDWAGTGRVGAPPSKPTEEPAPRHRAERICRGCGCTDERACRPYGCYWVEWDLCNVCRESGRGGTLAAPAASDPVGAGSPRPTTSGRGHRAPTPNPDTQD